MEIEEKPYSMMGRLSNDHLRGPSSGVGGSVEAIRVLGRRPPFASSTKTGMGFPALPWTCMETGSSLSSGRTAA